MGHKERLIGMQKQLCHSTGNEKIHKLWHGVRNCYPRIKSSFTQTLTIYSVCSFGNSTFVSGYYHRCFSLYTVHAIKECPHLSLIYLSLCWTVVLNGSLLRLMARVKKNISVAGCYWAILIKSSFHTLHTENTITSK